MKNQPLIAVPLGPKRDLAHINVDWLDSDKYEDQWRKELCSEESTYRIGIQCHELIDRTRADCDRSD